jgi:hypothetical protein
MSTNANCVAPIFWSGEYSKRFFAAPECNRPARAREVERGPEALSSKSPKTILPLRMPHPAFGASASSVATLLAYVRKRTDGPSTFTSVWGRRRMQASPLVEVRSSSCSSPSQNLTHWRVFPDRESPTYQPRAKSIPRPEKRPYWRCRGTSSFVPATGSCPHISGV